MINNPIKLKDKSRKESTFVYSRIAYKFSSFILLAWCRLYITNAGVDFNNLSYRLGIAIVTMIPLLAYGVRYLLL